MRRPLTAVLPSGAVDPAAPSGGSRYDVEVVAGLRALGRDVTQSLVPGTWPQPTAADRLRLAVTLAAVPAGAPVILDGLVACAAPEVLAAHSARCPMVVIVHLPLADERGLPAGVARRLDGAEGCALRAARLVVATSRTTAARLVRRHRLRPDRVVVAPPGVAAAPPTTVSDSGGRLVCVASVTPRKGHDVLVEALAELRGLAWSCVCAGPLDRSCDHVAGLLRAVERHGLESRTTFTGPLTGAALDAVYADADLIVLPSRAEPYGMVVTEGLARGIPVVASDVDGVHEALGHAPGGIRPGLLVPPGDAPALADALRRWLTDDALRRDLRAAALGRRAGLPGWRTTARAVAAAVDRAAA